MTQNNEITVQLSESRFEALIDGKVAGFADFKDQENVRTFTHTEVDDAFEGQGVGSALVKGALDATRKDGVQVRSLCSFVSAYIDKHPEYQDLLA